MKLNQNLITLLFSSLLSFAVFFEGPTSASSPQGPINNGGEIPSASVIGTNASAGKGAAVVSPDLTATSTSDGFDYPLGKPDGVGWLNNHNGLEFLSRYDYGGACGLTYHPGNDFNKDGTTGDGDRYEPVYAASNGTVIDSAYYGTSTWGNVILIEHILPDGSKVWSQYGHLENRLVQTGAIVAKGDQIGRVGKGDGSLSAHLHFEIRRVLMAASAFPCGQSQTYVTDRYYDPIAFLNSHRSVSQCGAGTSTLRNRDNGPPIHPPGSLIKVASSQTVYLIDSDNRRRPITSPSVLAQLYNQSTDARTGTNFSNWVIIVGQDELDLYEQGGNISAALSGNGRPFPDGKLISYNGEVSIVTGLGNRRPFAAAGTFTGLGFQFCQAVNVSQAEYNSYPMGPPVDAMALLTSNVNLTPAGPYTTGQNINGSFTIKNVGFQSISFSSLGIGGRLNGGIYDLGFVSTTLSAGSSHPFGPQARQLASAGTYDFFAAYQETNGHWSLSVPAAAGVVRSRQIIVTNPSGDSTGPNLSITSHSNGQTVSSNSITLSGTASDSGRGNSGISSVTVNSVSASGGTASGSGTANWSRTLTLNQGANNITVVARDNSSSQNSTTQSITLNYQPNAVSPAQITSPANGAILTSGTVTFNWGPSTGASSYYLYVGNSFRTYDIYSNYVSGGSSVVSGLPVDRRKLYVTMWSLIDGVWQPVDYTYNSCCVDTGGSPAQITSPANGTTFSSGTVTFNWSPSTGASNYYLYVGNGFRTYDIYSNYVSGGSSVVSGLPLDRRKLYVTMWSLINGVWQPVDYIFNSCCDTGGSPARITSPLNGATFTSGTVTFNWSPSTGASSYYLYVGNSFRAYDIYSNYVSGGVTTVSGLPTDARPLYVSMWSLINGVWQPVDYVYQAFGGSGFAQITSPTNGGTFGSSTVTFNWSPSTGASNYYLYVGNGFRTYDIYSNYVSGGSATVTGLPTDGRLLYVSMWSLIGGVWQPADYSYRAFTGVAVAQITSPTNNSTLNSGTVTFNWSPSTGASSYYLYIGNNFQTYDLYSNYISGGVTTLSGFPRDGRVLYVTMWSLINGVWQPVNYTYRACNGCVIGATDGDTIATLLRTSNAPFNPEDWKMDLAARP